MAIDWMTKSYDPSTGQTILLRNKVDHLVQDGTYRCSLAYGDTFAWAELYGTYATGTLPTGVASLTCTRTSRDPAISTGTLSEGEPLYRYDTLTYTAGASSYFDLSIANPTVTLTPIGSDMTQLYTPAVSPRTREKTLDGVTSSGVSATGQMFTLKASNFDITGDIINISYYDKDGNEQTYTETKTASAASYITNFGIQCWRGGLVSWSVTSGSGYWSANSGTITVGYQAQGSTRTISAKTRKTRAIRFYKVTGVASYSVTYTDSNGTRTTTTVTPTSTYSTVTAFIGATVTWTATATAGYTVSPSSGTISASTSTTAVTVKPTATLITEQWRDVTTGIYTFTTSTWDSSLKKTSTVKFDSFGLGLGSYSKVRMSGTITTDLGTGTFTNVELNTNTTTAKAVGTAVISMEIGPMVLSDTLTFYVTKDNFLTAYLTVGGSIGGSACGTITISITSLQVYTLYDGSDVLYLSDDGYLISVTSDVAGTVLLCGDATFGSDSDEFSNSGWYTMGTVSAGETVSVGSSDLIGTSEDKSISSYSLWTAVKNSSGTMLTPPYLWEY